LQEHGGKLRLVVEKIKSVSAANKLLEMFLIN
jgi:hypothetical protein